jgi:hypothetical protein
MVEPFQLDANAASAGTSSTQKPNQNNEIGRLEQESKGTLLAMEPTHGSKINSNTMADSVTILGEADLSIPRKSLSRSSSSSSSESSSQDSFYLGVNAHQATLATEPGHGCKTDTDLMAYSATNLGEPDLSHPRKKLGHSSLSSSSFASESSPQDTFELGIDFSSKFSASTVKSPLIPKKGYEIFNHLIYFLTFSNTCGLKFFLN